MCIIWWTTGCPHCRRLIPVQLVQRETGHGADEPQAFVDMDTTNANTNTTSSKNQIPLYRLGPAQPETHKIHSIWRCYEVDTRLSVKESLSRSMAADMENGGVAGVGFEARVGGGFEAGAGPGAGAEAGSNLNGVNIGPLPGLEAGSWATAGPVNPHLGLNLSSSHLNLDHNNLHLALANPHTGLNNPGVLSSNNNNNDSNTAIPDASHVPVSPQTQGQCLPHVSQGLPSGNLAPPHAPPSPGPLPPGFPPPVLHVPPSSNLQIPPQAGSYSYTFPGHGHGPLPSFSLPLFPIPSPTSLSAQAFPLPSTPSPHFSTFHFSGPLLLPGPFTGHGHMPDSYLPGPYYGDGQQVRKGGLESFRLCPFLEHLDASDPTKKHPRESCWLTRCRKGKVGIVDGIVDGMMTLPTGQGRGMSGQRQGQGHGQRGHAEQVSGHAGRGQVQVHAGATSTGRHAGRGLPASHPEGDNVGRGMPRGATSNGANRNANPNPNANQHQNQRQNRDQRRLQWWKLGWFKLVQFYLPVGSRGSRLTMSDIEG
ncbi:hypothetical protein QBC45DRAFT_429813 [Copromyces sp. CBS 386.78]|nr:hypothetical protein QBC45DRAFT_429813 [Copromyces sp. CBS 386.78]